jgi:hypothetical protein
MRARLRVEDRKRKAEKEAAKKAEHAAAAKKEEERELKAKRQLLALQLDKSWDANDFGQGCTKKLSAPAIANMREMLERLRLRSPPLPKTLDAQWEYFVRECPEHFFRAFGPAVGRHFINQIQLVLQRLGCNALLSPGEYKAKRPRTEKEGDVDALIAWMRGLLRDMSKDTTGCKISM